MKVRRIDFYPDDWIAGTIGLTHEERSVYISVCAAIWSQGESPVDLKFVRQICPGAHFKRGLDGLVSKHKVTVSQPESGPKVAQKRAESELKRAANRTETSRSNGAYGGRPNGLAEPSGFSVRARGPSTTTNNHQPTLKRDSESGWKKIEPPLAAQLGDNSDIPEPRRPRGAAPTVEDLNRLRLEQTHGC